MKGDHQELLPMMKFSPEAVGAALENFQIQRYFEVPHAEPKPEVLSFGMISIADSLPKIIETY